MAVTVQIGKLALTLGLPLLDVLQYVALCCRSDQSLAAENLALRKQLAMYRERQSLCILNIRSA